MVRIQLDEGSVDQIAPHWHDAELIALLTDYRIPWETTITLRCEINPEEPRDSLIALGITSAIVELNFHDVDSAQMDLHYKTGKHDTISDWEVVRENGAKRHRFTTHAGSRLTITGVRELWLADTPDTRL